MLPRNWKPVIVAQRASTRMEIIERAAYSWINRFLALRAMETRGLIEETLRNNPEYDGIPEALFIVRQTIPVAHPVRMVVVGQCLRMPVQSQATALPGLFDLNDPGNRPPSQYTCPDTLYDTHWRHYAGLYPC